MLISIDRAKDFKEGVENVDLAIKMKQKYPDLVVGIDFSGDARKGDALAFVPELQRARDAGLKLSAHVAEVPNPKEVEAFLGGQILPDRFGHATCIHPDSPGGSEQLFNMLIQSGVPVECCLTSNVLCQSVKSYQDHHVKHLIQAGHPFSICTDDKAAFGCSLTDEYGVLQRTFEMSIRDLFDISFKAIDQSFAKEEEKKNLKTIWRRWEAEHLT